MNCMTRTDKSAIEAKDMYKRFGKKNALSGMSFRVPDGTVSGFLGPNGAGKTTALRLLLGLMSADSGEMSLLGVPMPQNRTEVMDKLGVLVESPSFIETMSGFDNLWWFGSLVKPVEKKRLDEVLEIVGLSDAAGRAFGTYSTGMKQRLGVAFSIIHNPKLLILDEPTNGMDPQGRAQMRDIFKNIHSAYSTTIFLSSHLLDEIQRLCDFVVIVDSGIMIRQGYVKDLLSSECDVVELRINENQVSRALEIMKNHPEVLTNEVLPRGLKVSVKTGWTPELNRILVTSGILISAMIPIEASLEETFLKLTDSNGA
ncbi:MAG: ABC transporter ATP-binding protein [Candidatus Riflebacteria bacterium]|nr:ABC transporter ATP-binding protein [Candidatus Riflebacteria bacterium]